MRQIVAHDRSKTYFLHLKSMPKAPDSGFSHEGIECELFDCQEHRGFTWVVIGPWEPATVLGTLAKGYEKHPGVRKLTRIVRTEILLSLVRQVNKKNWPGSCGIGQFKR